MSQENVELVRRGYEAVNQALATGADLAPLVADWHPEIVIEMGILEGTFRGPAGFIEFLQGQAEVVEGLRCEPREIIDCDDAIVVPMRLTGTARNTGIPFVYEGVHVWTLRDGTAVRLQLFDRTAEALEAVGLPE